MARVGGGVDEGRRGSGRGPARAWSGRGAGECSGWGTGQGLRRRLAGSRLGVRAGSPLAEPCRGLHILVSTQLHPDLRNGFMFRISLLFAALCCATPAAAQQEALWLRHPAISPDGSTLVFTYRGDLYRVPATGGVATRLTTHPAHDFMPVWSRDGRQRSGEHTSELQSR